MKIGDFAKKFSTNANTVRYYVNAGLLIPERHNSQYRFTRQCEEDMALIRLLKQFDFSIPEIHELLSLKRLSNLSAKDDIADYLDILEHKRGVLKAEISRLEQATDELEKYTESIRRLGDLQAVKAKKLGVPLEFMRILCCPSCESALNLTDAQVVGGQIMNAGVSCACGYQAVIKNGMFITNGRDISELDSPDVDRKFYKDLPLSWVTLFERSYNWMFNRMKGMRLGGKVMLENHINCYFFLYRYIVMQSLDQGDYYIISDKYPEMVALYKELIEQQNLDVKILFLADSSFKYPIRKNCVDIYVDYCSTNEYSIFNTKNQLFDIVMPYLKPNADVLGTYFYFDHNSASHAHLLREYPICLPQNYYIEHLESVVKSHPLRLLCQEELGYVDEAGSANRNFTFHVAGDRMYLRSFHYLVKP